MELNTVGREIYSYPSVKSIMLDRAKSALQAVDVLRQFPRHGLQNQGSCTWASHCPMTWCTALIKSCYSPVEPLTVVGLLLCRPFSATRLMVYSVPASNPRRIKEVLSTGISTSFFLPEVLT